jgi:hypothetical protein
MIRGPGDGGADRVGDAHGEGATGLAVAQGIQGVSRLAGLGNEEADVISVNCNYYFNYFELKLNGFEML